MQDSLYIIHRAARTLTSSEYIGVRLYCQTQMCLYTLCLRETLLWSVYGIRDLILNLVFRVIVMLGI